MTRKLIDRYDLGEVSSRGIWFRYGQYSILDCGKLMETHPMKKEMISAGVFVGWEALRSGEITRATSWDDLLEHLKKQI